MKPIEAAGVVVMGLEKNSHLDHISLDLGTHATYTSDSMFNFMRADIPSFGTPII